MNFNLTLIGQMITFGIFIWLTMRYIWPPIVEAMEERQKRIADGLSAADRATRELENAKEKVGTDLQEAKAKAGEIIEQANRRANQMVEDAKSEARAEGERLVANAQQEIDMEVSRAREQLRKAVSGLVVGGAEQVLGSEIDEKAHQKLLDELAAEL